MTNSTDHEPTTAADGEFTSHGVPHGFTSLTPFFAIPRAGEAVAYYQDVFGARAVGVTEFDGVVVHAELDFGQGRLQLGEPNPDYHLVPAPAGDDDCYSIALYCSDVDGLVARAVASGATIREPVANFVSGDRLPASATLSACAGPS